MTFDAAEHAAFLTDLASSLELEDAAARLGMPVAHLEALVDEGVVEPWLGAKQGMWKRRFRPCDLEGFLDALVRNADPSLSADPALLPVPAAARKAGVRLSQTVALLADGRLMGVAMTAPLGGYGALRVDPVEVRTLLKPSRPDRRTMSELADETCLAPHVLRALSRAGALPAFRTRDPRGQDRAVSIAPDEAVRFRDAYVALAELAKHAGVTPRLLFNRLAEAGAVPAFDHRAVGAVVYVRTELPDISRLLLVPWPAGKRRPRRSPSRASAL